MAVKYKVTPNVEGEIVGVRQIQDHGRIQIPKKIRNNLDLKDGDSAYWVEESTGRFYITKASKL